MVFGRCICAGMVFLYYALGVLCLLTDCCLGWFNDLLGLTCFPACSCFVSFVDVLWLSC